MTKNPVIPTDPNSSTTSRIPGSQRNPPWMDLVLIAIFIALAGLYAVLMVTDRIPLPGIVFIGILWLGYWVLSSRLSFATPMDMPIIILIGLLPLSLVNTVDIGLTLPKVYGLVLGVIIFYWIVNYFRGISRLHIVILGLIILAAAIPLLGLIGADWSGSGYSLPSRMLGWLTSRFGFIERLLSGGGIHVNTIGGTLAFFVPLLLGLILDGGAFRRAQFFKKQPGKTFIIFYKLILVLVLALVSFILFLTESRGSYLGSVIGVLALLVWKDRRFLWLIPVLLVGLILVFVFVANSDLSAFIAIMDTTQEKNTLQLRLDYWERTIYLIQDFPFTGAGLGIYNKIFQELYLFLPFASESESSFYSHNLYLGVTASMGIPALVLYFSLLGGFSFMVFTSINKVQPIARVVLMGLSCGFLAHLVYGIMDNYLPGEKLGAVMWIYFGIVAAIFVHKEKFANIQGSNLSSEKPKARISFTHWFLIFLFGFIIWVMISLLATASISKFPNISLVIAAAGGVILGVVLTGRFNSLMHNTATSEQVKDPIASM